MGFFDGFMVAFFRVFGRRKVFSMQPADLKMWQASRASSRRPMCDCLEAQYGKNSFQELRFHREQQDTNCQGWAMLNELIEKAVARRSKEFAPGLEIPLELWSQITTLPPSISRLDSVRKLYLYSSYLVRLPPQIGDMANLEELDLYTSYRLHWVPYEVMRCRKLVRSRFSTRALYGNYKYRPPFPRLGGDESKLNLPTECSVCRRPLDPNTVRQAWISLRVATDVLPLLLNACSDDCIRRLPAPAFGYVDRPHTGGMAVAQPPTEFVPPRPGGPKPIM